MLIVNAIMFKTRVHASNLGEVLRLPSSNARGSKCSFSSRGRESTSKAPASAIFPRELDPWHSPPNTPHKEAWPIQTTTEPLFGPPGTTLFQKMQELSGVVPPCGYACGHKLGFFLVGVLTPFEKGPTIWGSY